MSNPIRSISFTAGVLKALVGVVNWRAQGKNINNIYIYIYIYIINIINIIINIYIYIYYYKLIINNIILYI